MPAPVDVLSQVSLPSKQLRRAASATSTLYADDVDGVGNAAPQ